MEIVLDPEDIHVPARPGPRTRATGIVTAGLGIDSEFDLKREQVDFYKENGFVKLANVFAPATLNEYEKEIAATVREHNTQTLPFEKRSLYDKAFLQIHNLWKKNETVKKFVMGKRLARIAAGLMGCRGVRLYHDQALFKEPGGGFTPWHADQQYWPLSSDRCVTAWIPLQKTPLEMGPLSFAPGSFRIKHGRDLEISEESEKKISHNLREYPVFNEAFELGDVSFHSGWTFHRAGANNTNRFREVMTVIYMDVDMRLAEPKNKNQQNDRDWWCPGVKVGDVIASPLNPVIFVREDVLGTATATGAAPAQSRANYRGTIIENP